MRSRLTIAVLTGQRPELLARTLSSFVRHQGAIWGDAVRVVVHNSGDEATAEVLSEYEWHVERTIIGELLSIGEASAHLLELVGEADSTYVLRLEDDWQVDATPFFDDSVRLLEDVGQVRLRKFHEPVLTSHRITKKPIRWVKHETGHYVTESAHYTHNPALMRTWDAVALGPYSDELHASRKFVEAGWASAQHLPGAFRHLGDRKAGLSLKWREADS